MGNYYYGGLLGIISGLLGEPMGNWVSYVLFLRSQNLAKKNTKFPST